MCRRRSVCFQFKNQLQVLQTILCTVSRTSCFRSPVCFHCILWLALLQLTQYGATPGCLATIIVAVRNDQLKDLYICYFFNCCVMKLCFRLPSRWTEAYGRFGFFCGGIPPPLTCYCVLYAYTNKFENICIPVEIYAVVSRTPVRRYNWERKQRLLTWAT